MRTNHAIALALVTAAMTLSLSLPVAAQTSQEGDGCCAGHGTENQYACCTRSAEPQNACCANVTAVANPEHDSGADQTAITQTQGRQREGRGGQGGPRQVHVGKGNRELMHDARTLVFNHHLIERMVEEIRGGAKTVTTTTSTELLSVLRRHPRDMYEHFKQGGHTPRK